MDKTFLSQAIHGVNALAIGVELVIIVLMATRISEAMGKQMYHKDSLVVDLGTLKKKTDDLFVRDGRWLDYMKSIETISSCGTDELRSLVGHLSNVHHMLPITLVTVSSVCIVGLFTAISVWFISGNIKNDHTILYFIHLAAHVICMSLIAALMVKFKSEHEKLRLVTTEDTAKGGAYAGSKDSLGRTAPEIPDYSAEPDPVFSHIDNSISYAVSGREKQYILVDKIDYNKATIKVWELVPTSLPEDRVLYMALRDPGNPDYETLLEALKKKGFVHSDFDPDDIEEAVSPVKEYLLKAVEDIQLESKTDSFEVYSNDAEQIDVSVFYKKGTKVYLAVCFTILVLSLVISVYGYKGASTKYWEDIFGGIRYHSMLVFAGGVALITLFALLLTVYKKISQSN